MNILPKKRWHVRTKDNIARVRRDEAQAAEEQKEKDRRKALAEQEARTSLLRDRAKQKGLGTEVVVGSSSGGVDDSSKEEAHVNLFGDIEAGEKHGTNKEYEADKKAEKEKWEKDIGLLTYLGKSRIDAQNESPWYIEKHKKRTDDTKERIGESDLKRKTFLDPMRDMEKYLDSTKKHKSHRHHSEKQKSSKHGSLKATSSGSTIDQLRAERLKREQAERRRTEQLLAGLKPQHKPETLIEDDRSRKYNSQFNPDFVRRRKHR